MNASGPKPLALGIVSDEIATDFRTAVGHGLSWGITRYEIRCLVSGRVPEVELGRVGRRPRRRQGARACRSPRSPRAS